MKHAAIILALLFAGCTRAPQETALPAQMPAQPTSRLLVKLRPGAARPRDGREIRPLGIFIIEARADNIEEAMRAMRARPDVEFVERDWLIPPAAVTPSDPSFSDQWHLVKINCPVAWQVTTGNGVVIAVLDTGVDSEHVDLLANLIPGRNLYNQNDETDDVYGHGSLVGGAAAAVGNNNLQVASVCWNCKIMPVRIAGVDGLASLSTILDGIVYAADHGARVVNLSFGAAAFQSVWTAGEYLASKGGVLVVAAGNNGLYSPIENSPFIVTVSATGRSDEMLSFSNTGTNIDVSAPGLTIYSTANNGIVGSSSGTSFSAPIVAGVAALVFSVNPGLTPAQVQDIIKRSSDDLGPAGWDPGYGAGRVNAGRAVAMARGDGSTPTPTATPTATLPASPSPTPTLPPPGDVVPPVVAITSPFAGQHVSGRSISVRITAADNVGVARIELYGDGALIGSSGPTGVILWSLRDVPKGSHKLQAKALDPAGNVGTSVAVAVTR